MKFIKWKILIATSLLGLSPILLGLIWWDVLPDTIAIHFDLNNIPDNYGSKPFVIFALPCLMTLLQIVNCLAYDYSVHKQSEQKAPEHITKWIIPIVIITIQPTILCHGMGYNPDVRRIAMLLVGIILIITGKYLPKSNFTKRKKTYTAENAHRINRFIGFATIIMGILALITTFLPPIASLIWIFLLIPYSITIKVYELKHKQ